MKKSPAAVRMPPLISLFALLLLPLAGSSCSQALPEILSVQARLVRIEGDDPQAETGGGRAPAEYLSFFCMVRDDDGIVDLEDLWLIHDGEELYWHLASDQWYWIEKAGENWIGSHRLAMPEGMAFPAGDWRIILADKGGERSERTLTLPLVPSRRPGPKLSVDGANYQFDSPWENHQIVAYGEDGARLAVVSVRAAQGRVRDLKLPAETQAIALWGEDADRLNGILTRPQAWKP